jgi:hypothetical protein
MTIHLNFDSVKEICQNSNQAMVYGWSSCYYKAVVLTLALEKASPILKVFDYELGDFDKKDKTLEGRRFFKIKFPLDKGGSMVARECKAAIIDLIFENFKRKQINLPIIPLIFCIDIDGKEEKDTFETIFARTSAKLITNRELRLCYKICCTLKNDPILAEITDVARETLKFVKLVDTQKDYELKEVPMQWDDKRGEALWNQRQETKSHPTNLSADGWRSQLKRAMQAEQKKTIRKKRKTKSVSTEPPLKKSKNQ